ncbi:MAG TPA: radical SAM family heme chaperone HemW [Candidatus Limnocylindrales bacterium]|nr:radical SAM family heme chaperone HemW [Candidatus Limnocylindrales bacterium]
MRPSFSIYVHLPYCVRKCPYCDFNTYAVARFPEERYVAALRREAEHASDDPCWSGRRVATVFFGGGTPSLFSPQSLGSLLEDFDRMWGLEADAEITMEANPGSFEGSAAARLGGFRACGIDRISFGAQSFEPRHLMTLGRIHSPQDTVDAVAAARQAGFQNLSCDLIFAIPGQTVADWAADLRRLVELGPDHVSAYNLTYEDGTPMTGLKKAGLLVPAEEETELEMFRLARCELAAAGYAQYEVSNFARPRRQARHNLAYWTWRDYLGLGAGAHGFAAGDGRGHRDWGRRYANKRIPEAYMSAGRGCWHASAEELTRDMAVAEYLMVGLRLSCGIDEDDLRQRFGVTLEAAAPRTGEMIEGGLLVREGSAVRLTERGLEIADAVISRLAAS